MGTFETRGAIKEDQEEKEGKKQKDSDFSIVFFFVLVLNTESRASRTLPTWPTPELPRVALEFGVTE